MFANKKVIYNIIPAIVSINAVLVLNNRPPKRKLKKKSKGVNKDYREMTTFVSPLSYLMSN